MNMDVHNTSSSDVETTEESHCNDHEKENGETKSCQYPSMYLEKLYIAITEGDRIAYIDTVKKILSNTSINLSSVMFEGDYVADLHKSLTPLQLICGKGDKRSLLELLKQNIDVNYCGKYGKTPLNISCLHGHLDLTKLLISNGAHIDASNLNDDCDTALLTTVACYQPELNNAHMYLEIIRQLLGSGACSNKCDKYGISPLFGAVEKADVSLTNLLLRYGANPNQKAGDGSSPLTKALEAEQFHNVLALLDHGCVVNTELSPDKSCNSSALHIAIRKNNLKIVLALINAGANPDCFVTSKKELNVHGSPLHLAASKNMLVSLWLLIMQGGNKNSQLDLRRDTPLLILVRLGSIEGVKLMLRLGADVELESQMGTTPIWAAVRENHRDVLQLLLETCCGLEVPSMEYHMYMPLTPLEISLKLQYWHTALTLLNAGANHKISIFKDAIPASVPVREQRITRNRAAYRLSPEDHRALKELRIWRRQPKCLKHICRSILRSHFTVRLPKLLKLLAYPISLQKYLFMNG